MGKSYEFIIFVGVIILFIIAITNKFQFPQPRPLPVQIAIREVIGRCVELGRGVLADTGRWASMSSSRSASAIAGLSVLSYIGSLCAELDCSFAVVTQNVAALPLITQTIESQYVSNPNSIKPEIRFLPDVKGPAYEYAFVAMAEREKMGAVVSIGPLGASSGIRVGALTRLDAMTIMGTDKLEVISFAALCSDYIVVGEEMFVLGAVLGGDEISKNIIGAQDVFKALVIATLLILFILNNLGFPIKI